MTTPLLTWENLAVAFADRTLFAGLSGRLLPGERVRVTGPSGSGKTTFLRTILGFVPPATGSVTCARDIRDLAAYVPQEADFGTAATAGEWLARVFSYRRNRVEMTLSRVEMPLPRRGRAVTPWPPHVQDLCAQLLLPTDVLQTSVSQISGGEKQRLALVAALALPREVLVLDEPFSALDAEAAAAAARAIVASGRAVLYASHVDRAVSFATREVTL